MTMGCCGKNRLVRQVENDGPLRVMPTPRAPSAQYFEYIGKTSLTAFGPVTGRHYRFARPGALLAVDERDGPSMAGVPNLRRASAPE
jgi:hypothetical protein